MPRPEPPTIVTLRYCPECGRHDRHNNLRVGAVHNTPSGRPCPGEVVSLAYTPQVER